MNDKIRVNLLIAGNTYPLTIRREEEELVRAAAKQINDRLNTYRAHYPTLEEDRIIAMVSYEMSVENLKLKQRNDTLPYTNKIEELTNELEDYFKESQP